MHIIDSKWIVVEFLETYVATTLEGGGEKGVVVLPCKH